MRRELARCVRLLAAAANEVIFRQGDEGDSFYIVLSGHAQVTVERLGVRFRACTLGPGESFGDRALASNEPRAATVQCLRASEFVALARADYAAALRRVHERELSAKLSFLRTLPFVHGLPPADLTLLGELVRRERFSRNTVVMAQGDKHARWYAVATGECRMLKSCLAADPAAGGARRPMHFEVGLLHPGDFFGECSLFATDALTRAARPRAAATSGTTRARRSRSSRRATPRYMYERRRREAARDGAPPPLLRAHARAPRDDRRVVRR